MQIFVDADACPVVGIVEKGVKSPSVLLLKQALLKVCPLPFANC